MVVENHPLLDDGTPFPTLFWLTCPVLVKRASKLEGAGRMAALNALVGAADEMRTRIDEAADRYRDRRDERARVSDAGAVPGGGSERIKCLHAHLAHDLADPPNPVGAMVLAQVGWPDCRVPCVGDHA